ncbi:hypothetical protein BCR32DRAFT_266584 [Anaeromyces robustus]|uniref:Thioredoxin domain-containing protein n=1 Tax=Anaeromyces robustus TaxID=1754192 RepID=A0A1Y1XE24_9FUNG|nr:hypothetical protein BCR32DRAFT_266584 [Anaeromyces robustus]|eukprot:ORX84010.1 hypothetical protein BCR32DRAFT_266584 [Anaeromyces robustus]
MAILTKYLIITLLIIIFNVWCIKSEDIVVEQKGKNEQQSSYESKHSEDDNDINKYLKILSPEEFKQHGGPWLIFFGSKASIKSETFSAIWLDVQNEADKEKLTNIVNIAKVECTQYAVFCKENNIEYFPTLILFNNGKKVNEFKQYQNANDVIKYLREVADIYNPKKNNEENKKATTEEIREQKLKELKKQFYLKKLKLLKSHKSPNLIKDLLLDSKEIDELDTTLFDKLFKEKESNGGYDKKLEKMKKEAHNIYDLDKNERFTDLKDNLLDTLNDFEHSFDFAVRDMIKNADETLNSLKSNNNNNNENYKNNDKQDSSKEKIVKNTDHEKYIYNSSTSKLNEKENNNPGEENDISSSSSTNEDYQKVKLIVSDDESSVNERKVDTKTIPPKYIQNSNKKYSNEETNRSDISDDSSKKNENDITIDNDNNNVYENDNDNKNINDDDKINNEEVNRYINEAFNINEDGDTEENSSNEDNYDYRAEDRGRDEYDGRIEDSDKDENDGKSEDSDKYEYDPRVEDSSKDESDNSDDDDSQKVYQKQNYLRVNQKPIQKTGFIKKLLSPFKSLKSLFVLFVILSCLYALIRYTSILNSNIFKFKNKKSYSSYYDYNAFGSASNTNDFYNSSTYSMGSSNNNNNNVNKYFADGPGLINRKYVNYNPIPVSNSTSFASASSSNNRMPPLPNPTVPPTHNQSSYTIPSTQPVAMPNYNNGMNNMNGVMNNNNNNNSNNTNNTNININTKFYPAQAFALHQNNYYNSNNNNINKNQPNYNQTPISSNPTNLSLPTTNNNVNYNNNNNTNNNNRPSYNTMNYSMSTIYDHSNKNQQMTSNPNNLNNTQDIKGQNQNFRKSDSNLYNRSININSPYFPNQQSGNYNQ